MTQKSQTTSQPQPQDELSDRDLEAVSAGTSNTCRGPGDDLVKNGISTRTRPAS